MMALRGNKSSYDLDLRKPYDYMVARVLLDIANKREGCELTQVHYSSGEASNTTHVNFNCSLLLASSARRNDAAQQHSFARANRSAPCTDRRSLIYGLPQTISIGNE